MQKKPKILLTQFGVIIYVTSEFNLYEKTETLLSHFWIITYIASAFSNLHN